MNLMKFFGFETDDDDYDDNDDYTEDTRTRKSPSRQARSGSGKANAHGKLILYKGIATEADKRKLRDAFNDGAMILIDLHELNQREFDEGGKDFITFMGGVAFSRNGKLEFIEPAQYLVTPREDMFEKWTEEGHS